MPILTGNTYPVKEEIKKLGGKWDADARGWDVPADKFEAATALVNKAPAKTELSKSQIIALAVRKRGGTPGVCGDCGASCKWPYDECWDCKEERDMGY